jgi:hypothetical protein
MFATLAQATGQPAQAQNHAYDAVIHVYRQIMPLFSKADGLARPDVVVEQLQTLGVVWALVFLAAGALCLFKGSHHYRIATITLAFLIGSFLGYWLGEQVKAPLVVAGCVGLLVAVIAFPLMKYAVAIMGGLAGAFLGGNLWSGFAHAVNDAQNATVIAPDAYWIGALVMLMFCGMLAFMLFKLSIVMFTSVSGATIAVIGALALLLSYEPMRPRVTESLTASQIVIPLLVFVPAAIAFILHESHALATPGGGDGEDD